ncbi:MAG: protoheme IX farnesyltransferase [Micavibrio aeruginosavorus]|uniref:Protoheme IX farnesyltransferase n=1 Tax=Micavibrio aeruginosavorus TaxID=349221 RepID=A0A2W5N7E0_9BACT|nr:MAG: protoheme IX farnesyltransferase [Micavibrio aeruginosavorus]
MSETALLDEPMITPEATVKDYFTLLKPKVMSLVVFTGFAGMWVAPGFANLHPVIAATAVLCIALGAGAAGAINMWYDRDIDAVMNRTKNRPIPLGRINPDEALSFGVILSILSVMTMGVAVNWTAGALLGFANAFYVFIYTMWLKRRTPQNIVIGGAAGAFPPMIGWAAVTGDITTASIVLFAIIFFWTPPHFWALSLFANEDYKRANIPMLPVVSGERATKIQMLCYTLLMVPLSVAPYILGIAGLAYGIIAFVMSVFFLFTNFRVLIDKTHKSAKLMFGYSVFYLFALFAAMMIDKV